MYKAILQNISGIEIWPMVGLTIFLTIFIVVTIWVVRLDKKEVNRMANIPLDDNELINNGDVSDG